MNRPLSARDTPLPSLREAVGVWARIGCLSFGGPAAQIALMHREVVEERRWISEARFLQALNLCMLLPGPEAQQLATYLGWLLHGVRGGLAAGLLFILPGAAVMLALSGIYVAFGGVPLVAALFFGLKCAVLVLVVEALLRIARRALHGRLAWALALTAFLSLAVLRLPFPLVVLGAAAVGAALPRHFGGGGHGKASPGAPALLDAVIAADPGRLARMAPWARRAGLVALVLWLWPVALLLPDGLLWGQAASHPRLAGDPGVFGDIAWFFSKMAVVTFGGAYAVLAYVAQEAVEHYHWLSAGQMLSGLGLAETTPGPLILVLQFVGFLAGHAGGGFGWAVAGAALTLWVTFLPCFAWIFLCAPLIERLRDRPRLAAALGGVTAAVVGVIANLALWFGLRALFAEVVAIPLGPFAMDVPRLGSLDPAAAGLALLSAVLLFGLRLGVGKTLGLTALAGLALRAVAG
ncbi:chromate transporter [Humitalea rosea]|uniref:Chromate transporter n=1 Tax=Humitalea rosea TaxID=990373 RepID=A0A2W7HZC5_9PROT|nr:chromate efflux transporter [Humitalea rosea]PZW40041.1 chromate transporter [Humitalea rosea]